MLAKSFRAFFDIEGEVLSREGARKITVTAAGRVAYGALDYLIAGGLGTMVFWLNARQFSSTHVYLATLLYDFIAAAGFYWLSDLSGCDLTLGRSFRRAAGVMGQGGLRGRILAGLLLLGVSLKAIVWEGPEVICFLFQREIGGRVRLWLALFLLSAVQGVFGAWLYTTGYTLWQRLGGPVILSNWFSLVLFALLTFLFFFVAVRLGGRLVRALWRGKQ